MTGSRSRRTILIGWPLILLASTLTRVSSASSAAGDVIISTLSNRADLVSGGQVLVAVTMPGNPARSRPRVTVGGRDVTREFAVRPNGRYEGLVTGLRVGQNVLRAGLADGRGAQLTITNHPNGGPVFSGPQVRPWTCQPGAVDKQCNQPAVYDYYYMSTDRTKYGLQPYDPKHPPSDVATTTTDRGQSLPFIARRETGYQDRDQYVIFMLDQPGQPWTPWAPQDQWNHKLVITHGGSCGESYQPGTAPTYDYSGLIPATPAMPQSYEVALGAGFGVLSTALDNLGHNCNIATEAESLVMAKEHLIETYGELRYTIGTGCSGGSIVQQQVANAYPGIYQGLLVTCSFPDVWTSATQIVDYHLLRGYLEDVPKSVAGLWTPAQWSAVEGNALPVDAIASDVALFGNITPEYGMFYASTTACQGIPSRSRYDALTRPGGVRCGLPDYMINVLGPRPRRVWGPQEKRLGRGFAGVPLDNVGVQYGLSALEQGLIVPAEFVDLNAKIGGLNVDFAPMGRRIVADQPALANAYRSGVINEANNLDQVAIIDSRGPDPGAAHDSYRTFALRDRLDREHGTHANQLVWEGPTALIGDVHNMIRGLFAMDRWLSAVEADHHTAPLSRKVISDKPADLGDECDSGTGNKISDGLCPPGVVPVYGTPRTVAGQPLSTDQNKCELKPLRRSDYPLTLTAAQWAQLQQTFPTGVCDYTKPGVDQQRTLPWLTYQDTRGHVVYGGRPLGGAPQSEPFR